MLPAEEMSDGNRCFGFRASGFRVWAVTVSRFRVQRDGI